MSSSDPGRNGRPKGVDNVHTLSPCPACDADARGPDYLTESQVADLLDADTARALAPHFPHRIGGEPVVARDYLEDLLQLHLGGSQ